MITPSTNHYNLEIKPDFSADTVAELDSDLATYLGKYVYAVDTKKVYFVETDDTNTIIRIDAYEVNYDINTAITPLYIQDTTPTDTTKYLWIQTNVGGNPADYAFWFNE